MNAIGMTFSLRRKGGRSCNHDDGDGKRDQNTSEVQWISSNLLAPGTDVSPPISFVRTTLRSCLARHGLSLRSLNFIIYIRNALSYL